MMIATAPGKGGFRPESRLYRSKEHLFRGSLGRFATGVAVVTFDTSTGSVLGTSTGSVLGTSTGSVQVASHRRGRHGITVNSFTSVSMTPPLVLVSIARTTAAHGELEGRPFTVNVLGAEQEALASHFAGKPNAGFEPVWVEGDTAPRLSGVLSYFQCTPWATYDGGDHTLYLGEVQEFDYRAGDALGFVNGRYTPIPEYLLGHEALL